MIDYKKYALLKYMEEHLNNPGLITITIGISRSDARKVAKQRLETLAANDSQEIDPQIAAAFIGDPALERHVEAGRSSEAHIAGGGTLLRVFCTLGYFLCATDRNVEIVASANDATKQIDLKMDDFINATERDIARIASKFYDKALHAVHSRRAVITAYANKKTAYTM